MKKYIVVKHNLMRKQKFYKRHRTADSWSVNRKDAYQYRFRFIAERFATAHTNALPVSLRNFIVEIHVEEVNA